MTNPQLVVDIYNQNAQRWLSQGVVRISELARKIAAQMDLQGIKYKHSSVSGDLTYAAEALGEATNLLALFRLDLLVVRPIRELKSE